VRAAYGAKLNARNRELLELSEKFADGLATEKEWIAGSDSVWDESLPAVHQAVAVVGSLKPHFAAGWMATQKRHRERFGKVLRAMVGPGLPWSDDWRTDTVVALARGMYDDRAWDRFPILSDALQDAGCSAPGVIGYCRGDGPFCRGCWLLDTILAKR
jgi:hypothetical protein